VSVIDPLAVAGAALVVTVVGMIAGLVPARRATNVDPMRALRWD
jgi:ABC-type antimicrobial peptide transport system permease subunit